MNSTVSKQGLRPICANAQVTKFVQPSASVCFVIFPSRYACLHTVVVRVHRVPFASVLVPIRCKTCLFIVALVRSHYARFDGHWPRCAGVVSSTMWTLFGAFICSLCKLMNCGLLKLVSEGSACLCACAHRQIS